MSGFKDDDDVVVSSDADARNFNFHLFKSRHTPFDRTNRIF